jgi:hypothetical protein
MFYRMEIEIALLRRKQFFRCVKAGEELLFYKILRVS